MAERVALYLQDAHDLRDGLDYVRYAEAHGFEAVWQAEFAAGARCDRAHGCLRRGDRTPQNRLRRDQ